MTSEEVGHQIVIVLKSHDSRVIFSTNHKLAYASYIYLTPEMNMMNKKRFIDFVNYLEGFTQRIIERYPNTTGFIHHEKSQMLERFPEVGLNAEETQQRNRYDAVKETLDLSVNTERSKCYHGIEIKRETPENCVESINLLSKAIGNSHRDILHYSALQGDLLVTLRSAPTP